MPFTNTLKQWQERKRRDEFHDYSKKHNHLLDVGGLGVGGQEEEGSSLLVWMS